MLQASRCPASGTGADPYPSQLRMACRRPQPIRRARFAKEDASARSGWSMRAALPIALPPSRHEIQQGSLSGHRRPLLHTRSASCPHATQTRSGDHISDHRTSEPCRHGSRPRSRRRNAGTCGKANAKAVSISASLAVSRSMPCSVSSARTASSFRQAQSPATLLRRRHLHGSRILGQPLNL